MKGEIQKCAYSGCGQKFTAGSNNQKYCSLVCRARARARQDTRQETRRRRMGTAYALPKVGAYDVERIKRGTRPPALIIWTSASVKATARTSL